MKRLGLIVAAGVMGLLALVGGADAQTVSIDLGNGDGLTTRVLQTIALLTILSLAPSIVIMTTSFVRIVVVLSLLRTAIGLQQSPPNAVMISLAIFLTVFVMTPTFNAAYSEGIEPLMNGQMEPVEGMTAAAQPVKAFMLSQVQEDDLQLFIRLAEIETPDTAQELPFTVVAPAFIISEISRAFEIGFLLFIPFLVIDMVVASVLMSMGMMMLPPIIISLPFKLIFFVLIDGWYLLVGSLVRSFGV